MIDIVFLIDRQQFSFEDFFSQHLSGSVVDDNVVTYNGDKYDIIPLTPVGLDLGDVYLYKLEPFK